MNGSKGKTTGLEPGLERVEVDQLATGAVDDPDPVAHLLDRRGVDPVHRLRGFRQVDRDQVRTPVELLAPLDALDPELAEALGGDEHVERDHLHVEPERPLGDQLADAAEPDHPERLPV